MVIEMINFLWNPMLSIVMPKLESPRVTQKKTPIKCRKLQALFALAFGKDQCPIK